MPQNRLAELRRASGRTQAQLSELMGVTPQTINRWETGKTGIPDKHKAALCDLFGVSVGYLLAWDQPGEQQGNGDNGEDRGAA